MDELRILWLSILLLQAKSAHHSKSRVVIFKYFGLTVFNLQVLVQLLNAKHLAQVLNAKKESTYRSLTYIGFIFYWLRELRFGKMGENFWCIRSNTAASGKISCLLFFFFLNTENKQLRTPFCCLMLITGLQTVSSFCFLVSCSYKFWFMFQSYQSYCTLLHSEHVNIIFHSTRTGQHELFCTLLNI